MGDEAAAEQQPPKLEIVEGRRSDGQPTIGAALIVRNEAETLGRLLDSLGFTDLDGSDRPAEGLPAEEVDESAGEYPGLWRPDAAVDCVVVCDTGSEDGTVELAVSRGCRVVRFEWVEDFGKARQASYDALPDVNFTLWADADDIIEGAELLRQLAGRMPAEIGGTIHRYDYAQDAAGNCVCELWRERLVRRGIGEAWKLAIHEVLEVPAPLQHVDEVIWHHRQPEGRERDPERNYKILSRVAAERERAGEEPDPRTTAYLGTEALALGRPDEAADAFRNYLASADAGWAEERCQVAHKLSVALRQLTNKAREEGDTAKADKLQEESAQAAFRAIQERPDWADGYLDLAEIALDREQPEQTLYFCDTAGRLEPPRTILIINPLEYSYQPMVLRSVALAKLGRVDEAFNETQRALSVTPYRDDLLGQASMLARQVKAGEATKALLTLREMLVRHDENEKARVLMDTCAPYFVWDRPEVAAARLDQREMTLHSTDPDVYASYYRDNPGEAPFELQGVPIPEAHKAFARVRFLRDGLTEQAVGEGVVEARGETNGTNVAVADLRILDLSMNDGWMLANLASAGFGTGESGVLDGMDLNSGAVERANGRRESYPALGTMIEANLFTAPEHFEPGSYDAVACFETIEHVPDPGALIDLMMQMVKPGGRIYVSTPDGAFEQGNLPDWARVEQKGHLRAMRPHELCSLLCERGVVRDFAREQALMVGALEPSPRLGKVIFYAAGAEAAPEKLMQEGLGGSETALVKMAEAFARQGYDVRVYAGPPGLDKTGGLRGDHLTVEEAKITGQVLYAPATEWDPGETAEIFISSRVPEAFDRTIDAKRRVLWLHDADYGDRLTAERVERATDVVCLSEFQAALLREKYPDPDGQRDSILGRANVVISRNGIEPLYFENGGAGKAIVAYTSSPDRGLDVLLECWPQIRERAEAAGVRKPELHHAYAPVYEAFRDRYPHLQAFHRRLTELTEAAGEGVVNRGHLSQREVAELYAEARCWAYPSWTSPTNEPFPEISCITAIEAQAAGAIPVYLDYGALRETVQHGKPISANTAGDPPRLSTAWREQFVDAVVDVLANPDRYDEARKSARVWAIGQGWDGVAAEWMRLFTGLEAKATRDAAAVA